MTIIQAIILGIVEGLTEFLPVSSTAHLSFATDVLRISQTEFVKSFIIVIQFGAILAVCVLFFRLIIEKWKKLVPQIAAAFIPTAIIGFALYKVIKGYLIGNTLVAGIMLFVGGVVFLYIEYVYMPKKGEGKEVEGLIESGAVGAAQALAVVPGVSRSGAIIIYGLLRGYSRQAITTFAFLLAVPTMFAAAAYDLYKSSYAFSGGEWEVLVVGFVVAFIVAYIASKWFIAFVSKHSFKAFGWYRVIAGAVVVTSFVILK